MGTLTTGMLVVLLIAGGISALAMLSVFAKVIEHETRLHDLRNHVKELHYQHALYLARIGGRISEAGGIEIIEETEETEESDEALNLDETAEAEIPTTPSDDRPDHIEAQSLHDPIEAPAPVAA